MFSLRYLPVLGVSFILLPVILGVIFSIFPAFGYFPALNSTTLTLKYWHSFLGIPAILYSVSVSLYVGLISTAISLVLVVLTGFLWPQQVIFRRLQPFLSPVLSMPHLSFALGFLFFMQPSGWGMRFIHFIFENTERPLDYLFPADSTGIGLISILVLKEFPFLLLMSYIAQAQLPCDRLLQVGQSLGYAIGRVWLFVIFPNIYRQIRIPVFIVLIFSVSVADIPQITGPTLPSLLSVRILQWYASPDLAKQFLAAVGSVVQLGLAIVVCGIWLLGELGIKYLIKPKPDKKRRHIKGSFARTSVILFIMSIFGLSAIILALLSIWSVAKSWRYPDILPRQFSMQNWINLTEFFGNSLLNSLLVGISVTIISLLFCILFLERKILYPKTGRFIWILDVILFLPLFIPQISFLMGVSAILTYLELDRGWGGVIWMHSLFVIPYIYLSLKGPYLSWDRRYEFCALSLGKNYFRMWFSVKLPLLKRAILLSAAVGFSVSNALYLPTLFGSSGRLSTLVTETIVFANSSDWRLSAISALLLMVLPWLGYLGASILSYKSVKL